MTLGAEGAFLLYPFDLFDTGLTFLLFTLCPGGPHSLPIALLGD